MKPQIRGFFNKADYGKISVVSLPFRVLLGNLTKEEKFFFAPLDISSIIMNVLIKKIGVECHAFFILYAN